MVRTLINRLMLDPEDPGYNDTLKDTVVVINDLANFFNEISQQAMLKDIMEEIPELAHLANYMFNGPEHAKIFCGLHRLPRM